MVFKTLKMSEKKNTEFLSKYKDLKICSITCKQLSIKVESFIVTC